jgi:hypothetical protein
MADDKRAQEEAARLLRPGGDSPFAPGGSSAVLRPGKPSFDPPPPADITKPSAEALFSNADPPLNTNDLSRKTTIRETIIEPSGELAGGQRGSSGKAVTVSEKPGTKTLDYIALGLLLAPPAVVFEMFIKGEPIDWRRTAIATAVSWVVGGLVVSASHGWQAWRSGNWRIGRYLIAAESRFWVKAIIVAASIGFALALSSLLSERPSSPRAGLTQQQVDNLPVSPEGLPAGTIWNNSGVLSVVRGAPSPVVPQAPKPQIPTKNYSPAEKRKLLDLVGSISTLLNDKGLPAARLATVTGGNIVGPSKDALKDAMDRAESVQSALAEIHRGIWNGILDPKNSNFIADLNYIIDSNAKLDQFERATGSYTTNIAVLDRNLDHFDGIGGNQSYWISQLIRDGSGEKWARAAGEFEAWVQQCNSRIDAEREGLR